MPETSRIAYKRELHPDVDIEKEAITFLNDYIGGAICYNTNIHHRRSIRLKGYDYSRAGLYFITICCHDRICRFGSVENGEMALNEFGAIAHDEWLRLPERFHPVEFDIGTYKSLVANGCLDIIFNPTEWQRNKFYRT